MGVAKRGKKENSSPGPKKSWSERANPTDLSGLQKKSGFSGVNQVSVAGVLNQRPMTSQNSGGP